MHDVKVARPSKVLFPENGITKGDLIAYYERISDRMLPYLADRPLVLQRFPDGIGRPGFIQKTASPYYPGWIRKVTVKKVGGTVKHVVCDDAATLAYLANQACIAMHPWLCCTGNLQCPDQMAIDLDPSRPDDIAGVVSGALDLKKELDELGLPAYVKSTGSRGVHVVVPLDGKRDFEFVRAFARRLAMCLVNRDATRYTIERHKAKRRGRLFLDIDRNAYAQTAVATYSVRARPGAPVAIPLHWNELWQSSFRPDAVTIRNIFKRLDRIDDPWKRFWRDAASLDAANRTLESLQGE